MLQEYGKAVVEERTKPQHLGELARYLRMEYGPGTEPGYILAEMADRARRSRIRRTRTLRRVVTALSKVVRALVPNNGTKERARSTEPTR